MKRILLIIFILNLTACNKANDKDKKTAYLTGTASILMGASDNSVQLAQQQVNTLSAPADGNWNLSPKKARITFTRIDFITSGGGAISGTLNNCQVTYQLGITSGSNLANCEFTLSLTSEDGNIPTFAGDYVGVYLYLQRTIPVLIEDSTANFYSDSSSATLLSVTPSSTTEDFVDYIVGGGNADQDLTAQAYFASTFALEDGDSPNIQIVTDMIHTIRAKVENGVPSFQENAGQRPVEMMAAPSGMTVKNEFYSNATTLNSTFQGGSGETYIRVFYANDLPVVATTNGYIQDCATGFSVSQAFAVNPATAPLQNSDGDRAGGYLGINNGHVYWALATNQRWTTYDALYKLERKSTLNADATLECQTTTTVPTPSGDTYSSEAPSITPTRTMTLKLLAN